MKTWKKLEVRKKALFIVVVAFIVTIMAYSLLFLAFPNVPHPIDDVVNVEDP